MKFLLLSVVLGLLYAGHGEEEVGSSRSSTGINSLKERAGRGSCPGTNQGLEPLLQSLLETVPTSAIFTIFVSSDGECVKKQVTGEKEKTLVYHIAYVGENKVIILHLSADTIIGSIHNVDEEGKETELVGIIGKRDQISDIDYEKFKKEASDRGILEENIMNFTDNDDCPAE
ncbi:hypothetical protein K5549_022001 [Capra hircus]|nr:hypothetical protein K5549_022001 [Capra hircus]